MSSLLSRVGAEAAGGTTNEFNRGFRALQGLDDPRYGSLSDNMSPDFGLLRFHTNNVSWCNSGGGNEHAYPRRVLRRHHQACTDCRDSDQNDYQGKTDT